MLEIHHLTLYRGEHVLLRDFNLQIAAGEVVTLMGPSGSGKSTLLNWMIGDLPPAFRASGELVLNQQRVDALPIAARRMGILFQDDLLFWHLSVGQNLAFALPPTLRSKAARRERIEHVLEQIGLAGMHDRDPVTLSGGQRARVSLMRALLAEPHALLLDEPFSKLDNALRSEFRGWVFAQIAAFQIPTLLVTHDANDVPPGGRVHVMGPL